MGKHYNKEDLDMYRNGEMSVLGKINCSIHVRSCRQCFELLDELAADDKLLSELRSSVEIFRQLSDVSLRSN